jgi:hypothetical protein
MRPTSMTCKTDLRMPPWISQRARKIIRKAIKNYLEMTSTNLNFYLGVYNIHNK